MRNCIGKAGLTHTGIFQPHSMVYCPAASLNAIIQFYDSRKAKRSENQSEYERFYFIDCQLESCDRCDGAKKLKFHAQHTNDPITLFCLRRHNRLSAPSTVIWLLDFVVGWSNDEMSVTKRKPIKPKTHFPIKLRCMQAWNLFQPFKVSIFLSSLRWKVIQGFHSTPTHHQIN